MSEQLLNQVLAYEWLNNSIGQYLVAFALFLVFYAVFQVAEGLILRQIQRFALRTKTDIDDALVKIIGSLRPPFYSFLAFYVALGYLKIEGIAHQVVRIILVAWITYQVVVAIHILLDYLLKRRLQRVVNPHTQAISSLVHNLVTFALWAFGVIFVLSNLGVNVTSLIAGFGVTGIAVALAAQNLLGDLISSLALYFDKPFIPGDFIAVGDISGTVQKIGIKTTRIRSLSGEEVIIPNRDIAAARVKNFKRMTERRVEFDFGVQRNLSSTKLQALPGRVRSELFEALEYARFGRAHVFSLSSEGYDVHVVYHVLAPDYSTYMEVNQAVLLGLKEMLEKDGMELAYLKQEHV